MRRHQWSEGSGCYTNPFPDWERFEVIYVNLIDQAFDLPVKLSYHCFVPELRERSLVLKRWNINSSPIQLLSVLFGGPKWPLNFSLSLISRGDCPLLLVRNSYFLSSRDNWPNREPHSCFIRHCGPLFGRTMCLKRRGTSPPLLRLLCIWRFFLLFNFRKMNLLPFLQQLKGFNSRRNLL